MRLRGDAKTRPARPQPPPQQRNPPPQTREESRLEAAIDALAEPRGISTDQKHWRRRDAATQLHARGILPKDLGPLHDKLNEIRKGVFYDGEEPDLEGEDITDVLAEIEEAVAKAQGEGEE